MWSSYRGRLALATPVAKWRWVSPNGDGCRHMAMGVAKWRWVSPWRRYRRHKNLSTARASPYRDGSRRVATAVAKVVQQAQCLLQCHSLTLTVPIQGTDTSHATLLKSCEQTASQSINIVMFKITCLCVTRLHELFFQAFLALIKGEIKFREGSGCCNFDFTLNFLYYPDLLGSHAIIPRHRVRAWHWTQECMASKTTQWK